MKTMFLTIFSILLLVFTTGAAAQQDGEARVTGDPNSEALQVVRDYLQTQDANLLAEDVQFVDQTIAYTDPAVGRDLVAGPEGPFFGNMFSETTILPLRYVVADNTVAAEFQYTGINTGPYYGAAATGLPVNMYMMGLFEVEDGTISTIRVYYDTASLQNQLGYYNSLYGPALTAPVAGEAYYPLNVDDVVDDTDAYRDSSVTVRGDVGDLVGQNAFVLVDQDLIDLDQEYMLVIPQNPDDFDFIPVDGVDVTVTGTIRDFVITDLETELERDLDDAAFGDYQDYVVMVAQSAFTYENVETLDTIIDDPTPFMGESVTVQADVGERLGTQAMYLVQDEFLDSDRILGVDVSNDDLGFNLFEDDETIFITGTVRNFVLADVENEFDVDLDDEIFADHENTPVILVNNVSRQSSD